MEHLKELSGKGIEEIVIVPISFLNENLETLYDLDCEIIPDCKKELNIKDICRVEIPKSDEKLVGVFVENIAT